MGRLRIVIFLLQAIAGISIGSSCLADIRFPASPFGIDATPTNTANTAGFSLRSFCSLEGELQGDLQSSRKSGGDTWVGRGQIECSYPSRISRDVEICYFDWTSKVYDNPSIKMDPIAILVSNRVVGEGFDSFMGEFELHASQEQPNSFSDELNSVLMGTVSGPSTKVNAFVFGADQSIIMAGGLSSGLLVITRTGTRCQDAYDFSFSTDSMETDHL
ncbi:MAG: hypothetical protein HRT45_18785 [Bdellovibrionales bacterium]|nr:hypothetical protein [Bdellovibrionales bacterium]